MPKILDIFNAEKHKLTFGSLRVNKDMQLPIAIIKGSGKSTCFISGGMHGDEINGTRLVQLVMHSLSPKNVKGSIVFLPIMNPSGFHQKQRYVVEDNKDLNRCFPGDGNTISYKIAKIIFEKIIRKCDFGIDCHDSGHRNVLLPQPRVHLSKNDKCSDGCSVDLGKLFGTKIILERKGDKGMMAVESFNRINKQVLTFEVGGGMVLWEDFLNESIQGIKNVLIHKGFIDGEIKLPQEQFVIGDVNRFSYNSEIEGLLYKKVSLGKDVHHGDLLAIIHNPINEKTDKVFSNGCGFVFSIKMQDKVDKDETILSILQTNLCKLHGTKPIKGFRTIFN